MKDKAVAEIELLGIADNLVCILHAWIHSAAPTLVANEPLTVLARRGRSVKGAVKPSDGLIGQHRKYLCLAPVITFRQNAAEKM